MCVCVSHGTILFLSSVAIGKGSGAPTLVGGIAGGILNLALLLLTSTGALGLILYQKQRKKYIPHTLTENREIVKEFIRG